MLFFVSGRLSGPDLRRRQPAQHARSGAAASGRLEGLREPGTGHYRARGCPWDDGHYQVRAAALRPFGRFRCRVPAGLGQIQSARDPRILQLGLKLYF